MAKKWIQKAINPKHKGFCTPMSKSTCTPARKALAKRFKKGGDLHKDMGGKVPCKDCGGEIPKEMMKLGGLYLPKAVDGVKMQSSNNEVITPDGYQYSQPDYGGNFTYGQQTPEYTNVGSNGSNLNLGQSPQGYNFGTPYQQNNNFEVDQQTNAPYLNYNPNQQQNQFNANPQQLNLQGQGYNYNYTSPNFGNDNNPDAYKIGDNQSTNNQMINRDVVDPSNRNAGIYPPNQKPKNQGWNSANYQDVFGHSRNYWGDFASNQFKAVDALSHAVPDTIGTMRQNKFTEINETNNKRAQQFNNIGASNRGMNQGITRADGGGVNAYQTGGNPDRANVEVEGNETVSTPDGLTGMMHGPSHKNGGIPAKLPQGTKVFSHKLKIPKTKSSTKKHSRKDDGGLHTSPAEGVIGDEFGKNNQGKPWAKIADRYATEDETKVLEDPNSDHIQKKSAEFVIGLKNQMTDKLFHAQETAKIDGVYGKAIQKKTLKDYKNMIPQPNSENGSIINMPLHGYPNRLGFWNGVMPGIEAHSSANGGVIRNGDYEEIHSPNLQGYFRRKVN